MRIKGDQGTARAMNRRLILNLLRREGPKSRAELAVSTGLSPATVTFVVADLLEEGFVIEGAASRGATGRRPTADASPPTSRPPRRERLPTSC